MDEFTPIDYKLRSLQTYYALIERRVDSEMYSIDDFYRVVFGLLIFFMQCGFAFLHAGLSRSVHATDILMKNMMAIFVTAFAWWIIGYTLAFGIKWNTIFGWGYVASGQMPAEQASMWFYQCALCNVAVAIVGSAIIERCRLIGYCAYALVVAAFIYPINAHWAWGAGWLGYGDYYTGYQDYAGSGVVHVTGGAVALVALILLGRRHTRFVKVNGKWTRAPLVVQSVPLTALGGFIVFFTMIAFNVGGQLGIHSLYDGIGMGLAAANSIIAASGGALTAVLIKRVFRKKWSLLTCIKGAMAGMIAVSAGANVDVQWGAFCTGCIGAVFYLIYSKIIILLRIDDPLDAFAVHWGAGSWGLAAQPIFKRKGILITWTQLSFVGLAWNLLGIAVLTAWAFVIGGILFIILRVLGLIRFNRRRGSNDDDDDDNGRLPPPIITTMSRSAAPSASTTSHYISGPIGYSSAYPKGEQTYVRRSPPGVGIINGGGGEIGDRPIVTPVLAEQQQMRHYSAYASSPPPPPPMPQHQQQSATPINFV